MEQGTKPLTALVKQMNSQTVSDQEKIYPTEYQVTFYSPTENVDHMNGEYTMPAAREICMTQQNVKCKLYDAAGFYKGYVDYDGSFFLN